MAGIYIHIPFCKRICSYCDFYKTTAVALAPEFITALGTELDIRKQYLDQEVISSIYFGGGTPTLLSPEQIAFILNTIKQVHQVSSDCEITLEANPDDLSDQYLEALISSAGINRISIGIQSFRDKDLVLLNRRHKAAQAVKSIEYALNAGFKNISIDLIYGIPEMDTSAWKSNLDLAFSMPIQHISAYHLSIEPGTAFSRQAKRGELKIPDDKESLRQFNLLTRMAKKHGFLHYEISNLAREGFISRHNSSYWLQKKYLGIGPSAHSFDIHSRQWNVAQVKTYMEAIRTGKEFFIREDLDDIKRYNEYLLVSLRTSAGANIEKIRRDFGEETLRDFITAAQSLVSSGHMIQSGGTCRLTMKGWLISDYIIARLIKEAGPE
jgi:oxygen-independent coproporphyrinogen III oxidase